ncbi:hypothetical protein, partial [Klebsiella pneumoniae]|uniref:hypothetical protein n=1 Tax=Klebsiella pneumoniae TaxID=573 RepID=UPI0039C13B3A
YRIRFWRFDVGFLFYYFFYNYTFIIILKNNALGCNIGLLYCENNYNNIKKINDYTITQTQTITKIKKKRKTNTPNLTNQNN